MFKFENLSKFLSKRGTYLKSDVLDKINYIKHELNIPLNIDEGPWMAGGSIIKLILGRDLDNSDLDVFLSKGYNEGGGHFKDLDERLTRIAPKPKRRSSAYGMPRVETSYAFTYQTDIGKLQLIHRAHYESPHELLGDFDFTICQFATDGITIAFPEQAIEDLNNRRLRLHMVSRIHISRFHKYTSLGFVPIPGESLKIHQLLRTQTNGTS